MGTVKSCTMRIVLHSLQIMTHGLTALCWLILRIRTSYYYHSFLLLGLFQFGLSGALSGWLLWSFNKNHHPIWFWSFPYFLAPQDIPGSVRIFPALPCISHCSKELWPLLRENQDLELDISCFLILSANRAGKYMYVFSPSPIHTSIFMYLFLWVDIKNHECILIPLIPIPHPKVHLSLPVSLFRTIFSSRENPIFHYLISICSFIQF